MTAKATREALGDEILELGKQHKDIFVIDCDVAKSCKTLAFAEQLPEQHLNVGISEQNAVGIAAGQWSRREHRSRWQSAKNPIPVII